MRHSLLEWHALRVFMVRLGSVSSSVSGAGPSDSLDMQI